METIQVNSSSSNSSVYSPCPNTLLDGDKIGLSFVSSFLVVTFAVGLPANAWVVWLIGHGSRDMLALDIHFLSLAVCEILYCLGLPIQLYYYYSAEPFTSGIYCYLLFQHWSLVWVGRPMFQMCICVDRYIAVVHPLIFLRLKPMKYRVVQCALAWGFFYLIIWLLPNLEHIILIWFVCTLCVFLFCTLSVLFSLNQEGPGERAGGERRGRDQMKRRAFNIILLNLACFVVNYLPAFLVKLLQKSGVTLTNLELDLISCLGEVSGLVQPLLYLSRVQKLTCCNKAPT